MTMTKIKTLTDLLPRPFLANIRKATPAMTTAKDQNDLYIEAIEAEIDSLATSLPDLAENLAELFSDPKTGQDSARRVLAFIGLCPDLHDRYRALFREEAEARLAARICESDDTLEPPIEPNIHIGLTGSLIRY
jgi:hypothetical protein